MSIPAHLGCGRVHNPEDQRIALCIRQEIDGQVRTRREVNKGALHGGREGKEITRDVAELRS